MSATKKLNLRLMEDSDIFAGETINNIVSDIDDKVLGIGHETSKMHFESWKANTDYQADHLVRVNDIPSWGVWECVTPGTSGNTPPAGTVEEMNFTDGTVVWKLRKLVNEGVTIHNKLNGRGVDNAHPISAITGLQVLLDSLITSVDARAYTDTKIADLIDGAPEALDTLKEIADALADDDNVISAIMVILDKKVDKVSGKDLSTNDYIDTDKAKVDKISEDTSGNFMYNGRVIVGGAEEWQPSTFYAKNQLLTFENLLYRTKNNHTSGTVFTPAMYDLITIGYIDDWKPNHFYNIHEVAIQGTSIIRCVTAHTSETDYNNVENNYWEVIASKGAVISAWKPQAQYGIDEAVVYNDMIYLSNLQQVSSNSFADDMQPGSEKWRSLNSGGSAGALKQVTKLGVVGSTLVEIIINNPLTFNLPPVEILKFAPGLQDQIINQFDFSSGDGSKFTVDGVDANTNKYVTFDGTVRLNKRYEYKMTKVDSFTGPGQYSEDTTIDDTEFKLVDSADISGGLVGTVLVNMRFNDSGVNDIKNTWTNSGVTFNEPGVFGGRAAFFGATGVGKYFTLSSGNISDFNFGSGDFTISFWNKRTGMSIGSRSWSIVLGGTNSQNTIQLSDDTQFNKLTIRIGSSNNGFVDKVPNPTAQWNHIAFTRQGGINRVFVNGAQVGTFTNSNVLAFGSSLYVGHWNGDSREGTNSTIGYLDDLVVVKGKALWTADFTPPTDYLIEDNYWLARVETEGGGIDDNVVVMMHCNDSSFTDIVDNISSDVNSGVTVNTENYKFGEGSLNISPTTYLNRTLKIPFISGYPGTSTEYYTIDFWMNFKSYSNGSRNLILELAGLYYLYFMNYSTYGLCLMLGVRDTYFGTGSNAGIHNAVNLHENQWLNRVPLHTWNHFAIDLYVSNGILRFQIRINGQIVGNGNASEKRPSRENITNVVFGARTSSFWNVGGFVSADCYIDEFRISSKERWAINTTFTPPTSQYSFVEGYYSNKPGNWSYLGIPSTDAELVSLFNNYGTDICPTQKELEQLGIGSARPRRCCYQGEPDSELPDIILPDIILNAVPKDKLIILKELLLLDSFEGIDQVNLVTNTANNLSLLHFNDDFTDETGRAWTTVGTPTVSANHSKFGGKSFQITLGNYLTAPNTDFLFGADNFTIDFQIYAESNTDSGSIFRYGSGNTTQVTPFHLYLDGGRIRLYMSFNNSSWGIGPIYSPNINLNQFNHVALVRNGSNIDCYLNGVSFYHLVSSLPFVNTNIGTGFPVTVGVFDVNGNVYLDEFRVTRGLARWTADFVPPVVQGMIDSSNIRFMVTTDLQHYKVFNFSTNSWEDIENFDELKTVGISYDKMSSIQRDKWDELTVGNFKGIGFAFLLGEELYESTAAIDSLSMQVDMKGSWDKAIHGTDYIYGYPRNNLLRVTLKTDGDYKINYSEGQKMI
ncbi:LamG domain-containing protein [Anaerosinus massiliensis]|uniref:LamG domain-containing protein n=1 Tax=Massilibacillus massiliensis TaxID=1806837 RepID=UPI000DA63464|nr:LamG domain-containing protein [Massilibacillus massiliensis]